MRPAAEQQPRGAPASATVENALAAEAHRVLDGSAPGGEVGDDGLRRVPGSRPPVLDILLELTAVPLAGVAWAGAVFREMVAGQPLDPFALVLRALALGLTFRAVVALVRAGRRLALLVRAHRHRLVVGPAGLAADLPGSGRVIIPREEILGVRERGDWRTRPSARAAPVYVVHAPRRDGNRPWVALPPVFAGGPGLLSEMLMRGLGPKRAGKDEKDEEEPGAPPTGSEGREDDRAPLASRIYDEVARGRPGPGVVALSHGRRWLLRGPQATVLLGLAILDGFLRLPRPAQVQLAPFALGSVALAVGLIPLGWIALAGRHVRVRKGLSLVFAPHALLLRTRSGVLATPYAEIQRIRIEARASWSPFAGSTETRLLILDRSAEDGPIRYDEAFIGAPAEVVACLVDGYRDGAVDEAVPGVVVRAS